MTSSLTTEQPAAAIRPIPIRPIPPAFAPPGLFNILPYVPQPPPFISSVNNRIGNPYVPLLPLPAFPFVKPPLPLPPLPPTNIPGTLFFDEPLDEDARMLAELSQQAPASPDRTEAAYDMSDSPPAASASAAEVPLSFVPLSPEVESGNNYLFLTYLRLEARYANANVHER